MRWLLLPMFSLLVFATGRSATAEEGGEIQRSTWEGVIRIGEVFHDVKLEQLCGRDQCELTIAVYLRRDPVAAALVRVAKSGGELLIGSRRYALDAELATRWLRQLRSGSICADGDLPSHETSGCSSGNLHEFVEGLTGKIEEKWAEVPEIRFFSLDEWPNPFGELVTLGIRRLERKGEALP